jgi:type VI secretion system protein ImpJ
VARRLREKAVGHAGRARSPAVASRAPQLLETKEMLRSVVAALPQLEALLATGVAHPFALYLALCQVVGQAAGLARGLLPEPLPAYDHADPMAALGAARDLVFRVLDEGILESYTGFRFDQEGGVFSIPFDESWRERPLVVGAGAPSGVPDREVAAWMAQCLIGSRGLVPAMRERRVLGAARTPIEGDGDLVPAGGVVLFSLDADRQWIEPNQLLEVVEVGERGRAARPIELVLYVRNRV